MINADPSTSLRSVRDAKAVRLVPITKRSSGHQWRLRKHADYQRVYKSSRKQQSSSMSYFVSTRSSVDSEAVARVGLTAGKVLGNAVERNRIKRRMREAVRANVHLLPAEADVVLHPRRQVLTVAFADLKAEVERIFAAVAGRIASRVSPEISHVVNAR